MDTCGLRAPEPEQGDALRLGALTRLRGFVSVLGEELRRDLESGSPHSDGTWQARCQSVESRQVQLQELRQMLDDVRETTPEEMRQILASNLRNKEAAPLDSVVQELHDAIGRNVRLARREAVLEAYCEEQHKILQSLESSESRDYEAKESLRNEELKEAKVAAEREAMELKVSWRKDRMELHRIQCELQQANQTVTNLEEQLSEAMQNQEAQRGLLQKTRVTDIQASVWQSKLSNQAKDLERLQSRCAELDNERILVRGQNRTLEAWASEAKHVEAQNALQKKIFQERCVELQAKLDQQRVAYYDKNRELEVMRIHHEEEKHQLQKQIEDASRDHDSWVKEKRMLQEKVTDLEVQIAESLLSGSYHAAEHGQLRARVEDLSGDKKSQELAQQLAELQTKYQDLEGHYAAANVARSGLARQCGLLEAETARLEESLAKELRDKDDALHAHASVNAQLDHLKHSASKASNFASRLEQFEAQQQKLEEEAAKDRSRLHLEMASAEAQSQDLERLRERERLVEQLKMQYHLGHKLLGHFREVHDALAWKDLMASVDQTILALFETPKTPSGGSGGPGPGDCILAEGVTQLHRLAESAEHAAERCAGQRSEAAEAAEQQQFAHEVQLQELETQNLRLKAELAKSQSLPDSRPALTLPDDVPEEYSAIIKEVVLNGWDSVEWGGNFTLLHWAAMQNRLHLCESLLELRANPSLKDDAGMTPADYAREKGSKDVLATLQSAQLLKLNLEAKRLGKMAEMS